VKHAGLQSAAIASSNRALGKMVQRSKMYDWPDGFGFCASIQGVVSSV